MSERALKVKVCGITNLKDAVAAEKLGADILGFIFAPSPRRIKPPAAKRIIRALKLSTAKAGVFVNEQAEKVNNLIKTLRLNIVQLSGDETPGYIRKIKCAKVIKAIRARNRQDLKKSVRKYRGCVYAFLFETYSTGLRGGTGRVFNWKMAKGIKVPFFIAGGLKPGNVRAAMEQAGPFGLDINSGVESRPGKKDLKKLRSFFEAVNCKL